MMGLWQNTNRGMRICASRMDLNFHSESVYLSLLVTVKVHISARCILSRGVLGSD